MSISDTRGSLSRRWGLHLHTPGTKLANDYKTESENVWDAYIEALEASSVQVFGLTDYFSCDNYFLAIEKYRARFPDGEKVFFPNVELRLSDAIGKEGNSPDMHVVFDNNPDVCPQEKITTFLQNLKTHLTDTNGVEVSCADLATKGNYDQATVSLKGIRDALKKTFGDAKPYLLIFPAKSDGIKSQDTGSPRKVSIAEEIDKAAHGFFGDSDSTEYFLDTSRRKKLRRTTIKP